MKKYKISIEGTTPLLFNVRNRDIELELRKIKKDKLDEWESENWRRKAEMDNKGNVIIPSRWLKKSFTDACAQTGVVPNFAKSKKQTYSKYAQSLFFDNTTFKCLPRDLKDFGTYVGAQGKNSSSKVWRIRPMVEKWMSDFNITDPFGRMNKDELKEILEHSGMIIGIGDGRSLNFGRFEIKTIKEIQ